MTPPALRDRPSTLLHTDKYKPVMAQAGFPLRQETFVLLLRKGGPYLIPFDLGAWVRACLPQVRPEDLAHLAHIGLPMERAYEVALRGDVEILAPPAGAWVMGMSPVLTVTGPSALVSHLEAQLLWLHLPIQAATLARLDPVEARRRLARTTCEEEAQIICETLALTGDLPDLRPRPEPDAYRESVQDRARGIVSTLGGGARAMEAGMRAVSGLGQHALTLEACRAAGITATSHMALARALGLRATGTTGHEHTQRWGGDLPAFQAVRDRIPGEVTYLLDTFSTLGSGLPAALKAMEETPGRAVSLRFDSEATLEGDYRAALSLLSARGHHPGMSLGGGFDQRLTARFEALGAELGQDLDRQRYMYGQYLNTPHVPLPTRGDVSAVYKLSETGGRPTMKFSDTPGKSSIPGRPLLFVAEAGAQGPHHLIGQVGEDPPPGYHPLSRAPGGPSLRSRGGCAPFEVGPSPRTRALIETLTARRRALAEGAPGAPASYPSPLERQ